MTWESLIREFWWYKDLWELNWRAWWWQHRETVDFIFNQVVLLTIAYAIGLVGLNLTRRTPLGRALGNNELTFAFVYFCAFLGVWISFFVTEVWRYSIRLAILFTAIRVILAQKEAYGGWIALHRRAGRNASIIVGNVIRRILRKPPRNGAY